MVCNVSAEFIYIEIAHGLEKIRVPKYLKKAYTVKNYYYTVFSFISALNYSVNAASITIKLTVN